MAHLIQLALVAFMSSLGVTLHHIITVYNDMLNHKNGVLRALAKKKIQWEVDLYFAVKFAWQKLSKYHTELTPATGMLLISAHILDLFRKLRSFQMWDKGLDINPEDETSYTTQYQAAFLKYVENEYCAKHICLLVSESETISNNNLVFSAMASRCGHSSYDPDHLCSDDDEYLMPNNVGETTAGWSDGAAHLLTAPRLYLNSPPELGCKLISILMIATPTQWRLVVHFGYQISPTGGSSRKKCTQSTPISTMWHAIYSLSYLTLSGWRAVFPLHKMWLGGGSQKPQARPFTTRSL